MRRLLPLALALLAAACGKKLPPLPPLEAIPARPEPLTVTQQATDVVLRFPFPRKTVTGAPLDGLTRVTVLRELVPAPPTGAPPAPPEGPGREREERLFLQRAERVQRLGRADLDEATVGSDVVVRDSLYGLFVERRLGRVFVRYAVTATRDRKGTSDPSPIVSIRPLVPPGAPRELTTTVEEGRVCLDWKEPVEMLDGSTPVSAPAYAVYRRDAAEGPDGVFEEPLGMATHGPFFVDDSVAPGRKYVYTVRAAPAKTTPLVLGPPAEEALADTRDVFPPKAPEGLTLLAEPEGVRLVWNPVLSADLGGYRVYRRPPGGGWSVAAPKVQETTWFDGGAAPGTAWGVSALDREGNESPRAEAAQEERR